MNHKRIGEITIEMSSLLDQQRELLNDTDGAFTKKILLGERR
jgi:hypothetical protein